MGTCMVCSKQKFLKPEKLRKNHKNFSFILNFSYKIDADLLLLPVEQQWIYQ